MTLIEDDHVVQTFAADGSDDAFDERICQGDRGAITTSSTPIP
jgi:hypothetical protein